MGVVIGRSGAWRQYLALAAALIAALVTFLAAGRAAKPRQEEPRVRLVDDDTTLRTRAGAKMAVMASLWLEGRGFECLVPAFYGADESARFSSVLRARALIAQRAPAIVSAPPPGALWARLAGVYEGAALAHTVSFEAGEPAIVSIRRSAKFTPRPPPALAA
jgi:hypothetical protein